MNFMIKIRILGPSLASNLPFSIVNFSKYTILRTLVDGWWVTFGCEMGVPEDVLVGEVGGWGCFVWWCFGV